VNEGQALEKDKIKFRKLLAEEANVQENDIITITLGKSIITVELANTEAYNKVVDKDFTFGKSTPLSHVDLNNFFFVKGVSQADILEDYEEEDLKNTWGIELIRDIKSQRSYQAIVGTKVYRDPTGINAENLDFIPVSCSRRRILPFKQARQVIVCFNCSKFGHRAADCKSKSHLCHKCASTEHPGYLCPKKVEGNFKCPSCSNNHPQTYGGCENYKKELSRIKIGHKPAHKPTDNNTQRIYSNGQTYKPNGSTTAAAKSNIEPHEINILNEKIDTLTGKVEALTSSVAQLVQISVKVGELENKIIGIDKQLNNVSSLINESVINLLNTLAWPEFQKYECILQTIQKCLVTLKPTLGSSSLNASEYDNHLRHLLGIFSQQPLKQAHGGNHG